MSTPIIETETHRVAMSYKGNCSDQFIVGVRYAWRESPCEFKQCALYSMENDLPAPPFIDLGLIGGGPQYADHSKLNGRWNQFPKKWRHDFIDARSVGAS